MDLWIDGVAVCINTFRLLCVLNFSWVQFNWLWTCYKFWKNYEWSNNCNLPVKFTLVWAPLWNILTYFILPVQFCDIINFAWPQKFLTWHLWADIYTTYK